MLIKSKSLKGYRINAIDADIGSVKEFFFDDRFWTVRYLVVETGNWFNSKQVLISPYFIQSVDYDSELVNVNLTKQQVADSPPYDSDRPVSKQYEEKYTIYYGTPYYWGSTNMWGAYPYIMRDREMWNRDVDLENSWNPNLRSSKEVINYDFQATDGVIGHVDDFIINDDTWTIRYFVLDTKNWLPGRKVLISSQWIDRISWEDSKVFVDLSRETISHVPEYDEDEVLTREHEITLHKYFNKQGYWVDAPAYSH